MMPLVLLVSTTSLLLPTASRARPQLSRQRDELAKRLEADRLAIARSELRLAELDEQLQLGVTQPPEERILPTRGYLSKTAGCYKTDGSSGPPPSLMTLALNNFGREVKELAASIVPYRTAASSMEEPDVYASALQELKLDNGDIWAREHARPAVPAPLVIKGPYLALCAVLDTIFDGRPIARFWYLETVARVPYFGYNTMIFLYETLGWWRRSAALKKVHFQEEWNEYHHLLIMEALGGDQAWLDRFIGQHSAIAYYVLMTLMWIVSPTLAYNFSELIEAHAVDTYASFLEGNEAALRELPPPAIALDYYADGGESGAMAPVESLYDVFCRIRDDEASHVNSMKTCQDPEVRSRARIVELASIVTALAILAGSIATVETVETIESVSAPLVAQGIHQMAEELDEVESIVGATVAREEADFEQALFAAETGANKWLARH